MSVPDRSQPREADRLAPVPETTDAELARRLAQAEAALRDARNEAEAANRRIVELEASRARELADQRVHREESAVLVARAEDQAINAWAMNEAMLGSLSWRITAPIRAVKRLLSGNGSG